MIRPYTTELIQKTNSSPSRRLRIFNTDLELNPESRKSDSPERYHLSSQINNQGTDNKTAQYQESIRSHPLEARPPSISNSVGIENNKMHIKLYARSTVIVTAIADFIKLWSDPSSFESYSSAVIGVFPVLIAFRGISGEGPFRVCITLLKRHTYVAYIGLK